MCLVFGGRSSMHVFEYLKKGEKEGKERENLPNLSKRLHIK